MSDTILAWNQKPLPDGVLYTSKALADRINVVTLFDACKHKHGYITADGWEFLFNHYGINELLNIDLDIKWFNYMDLNTHTNELIFEALIAGYNPFHQEKGDYDEEAQIFINLEGYVRKIEWKED